MWADGNDDWDLDPNTYCDCCGGRGATESQVVNNIYEVADGPTHANTCSDKCTESIKSLVAKQTKG